MTTIRRFTCDDLFSFNNVNLDYFTETVTPACKLCMLTCRHKVKKCLQLHS